MSNNGVNLSVAPVVGANRRSPVSTAVSRPGMLQAAAAAEVPWFGLPSIANLIPARNVVHLAFFLAFLQVLDGVLTSIGISRFGVNAEGNILLRSLMLQIGHVTALFMVKTTAIAIVGILAVVSREVAWVRSALGFVALLYLVVAIIPWTYILFFAPNF